MLRFQSTRPRGERQGRAAEPAAIHWVSIHAPARGATPPRRSDRGVWHSFNPRARAGSDSRCRRCPCPSREFQSTRPRGERHTIRKHNRDGAPVSIHAPARGATKPFCAANFERKSFQSTRPRGERPMAPMRRSSEFRFNPRARAGSDNRFVPSYDALAEVSIHAPARGATFANAISTHFSLMFQSTRPRGERPGDRSE